MYTRVILVNQMEYVTATSYSVFHFNRGRWVKVSEMLKLMVELNSEH